MQFLSIRINWNGLFRSFQPIYIVRLAEKKVISFPHIAFFTTQKLDGKMFKLKNHWLKLLDNKLKGVKCVCIKIYAELFLTKWNFYHTKIFLHEKSLSCFGIPANLGIEVVNFWNMQIRIMSLQCVVSNDSVFVNSTIPKIHKTVDEIVSFAPKKTKQLYIGVGIL